MLDGLRSTTYITNVNFIDDFYVISVKVSLTYVEALGYIVDVGRQKQWT